MGKILVYAEKPDQGKNYAKILSANAEKMKTHRGASGITHMENSQYVVTWGFGHIVQAKMPSDYKEISSRKDSGWAWDVLPFYPPSGSLDYKPREDAAAHLKEVAKLFKRQDIDSCINGCDAGREGELIFWTVYHYANCQKPVKRLWISNLTDTAIKRGMTELKDEAFFTPRKEAAYARQFADWAVGINLTRAATVKRRELSTGRGGALHVGRVKTPTTAIVVQRRREIENFKPEDYFEVEAEFGKKYKGQWFKTKLSDTKFDKKEEAEALVQKITGKMGEVTKKDVEQKPKKHPLLYSLSQLQIEAGSKFGYSPQHVLDTAQGLYERYKVTTYPRSDSTHLSSDQVKELEPALKAVNQGPYAPFASHILASGIKTTKRFVDDTKVSDHHAIIPTDTKANLNGFRDEKIGDSFVKAKDFANIYDLIVKRFLCVFYPDALYEKTEVVTEVEGETFKTSGNILISPGWKEVYGSDPNGGEEDDEEKKKEGKNVTLPPIQKGEKNQVTDVKLHEKATKPPSLYTYSELIKVMRNPRKFLEDKELKDVMRETNAGLGTEATRAGIIDEIIEKGYVIKTGKTLNASDMACKLIDIAPEELKSPIVTAEWEKKLREVEMGRAKATVFEQGIREFVQMHVDFLRKSQPNVTFVSPNAASETEYSCLKCGEKMMYATYKKQGFYVCKTFKKEAPCIRIFERTLGKKLTKTQLKELLTKGETKSVIKGLKNKDGKTYDAKIKLDLNALRAIPVFENKPKTTSSVDIACPFCGRNVEENSKAFGCTAWKDKKKCSFTLWKNKSKLLDKKQVKLIIDQGKTDVLTDMEGKKGKYSAYYVLDRDKKMVNMKFAN